MKKKISREELIEIRKREQARKEMEFELGRELSQSFRVIDNYERLREGKNPYVLHSLNFFGTLGILYALYFIILFKVKIFFQFFFGITINYGTYVRLVQVLFWIAAFGSLFTRKTVLDYLLDKFTRFMS